MMRRDEVQSFCQFLVRHRLIAAETAPLVLGSYDRGPLGGSKFGILHQDGASARSGAIIIVQELAASPHWLKPQLAEPIKLAELWQAHPEATFVDAQVAAFIAGHSVQTKRLSNPASDTVVATHPRAQQLPPLPDRPASGRVEHLVRPTRAKQEEAKPIEAKPPERVPLLKFGNMLVPAKIGDFQIEKPLGEGGMGAVFLARNHRTGLKVALKVMIEDLPGRASADVDEAKVLELRERFRREAIICMSISSPHVVRGYHLGEDDGILYLVMELIPGQDLGKFVQGLSKDDPMAIIRLMRDTARGVGAFHTRRVIHRDVKPANVMVDASGCPKLIDSGLVRSLDGADIMPARLASSTPGDADLTSNQMVGTPMYMSPEQAMSLAVGLKTDVYSLAKMLYFLLTGRHVHEGAGTIAVLRLVMEEGPLPAHVAETIRHRLPFGGLAKKVIALLEKGLAFQPADRHADANQFAQELDEILTWWETRKEQEAAKQAKDLEDERKAREEERALNRKLYIGLALACAFSLLLVFLSIFFAKARKEAEARAAAEASAAVSAREAETSARKAEAEQKLRADVGKQFLDCQALMRACKWVEAEAALLALIGKDASYEAAHYALARVQFNLRKNECVDQWQWLIEHGLESRRSEFAFYAIFDSQQLKPSVSDEPYEALLARITEPRYVGLARAELAFTRAERASRTVPAAQAITMMNEALTLVPAIPESDDLAWLDLAVRGGIKWRISQLASGPEQATKRLEARLVLQQSIARNPDFPMTWYWLVDILRGMGEHVAALAACERLVCLMPNWAPPQYLRADERMAVAQVASRTDSPEEMRRKEEAAFQISTETMAMYERLVRDFHMEPRQSALAKRVLFNALTLRFSICRRWRQTAEAEQVRERIYQLGNELMASPDLLPEERSDTEQMVAQIRSRP